MSPIGELNADKIVELLFFSSLKGTLVLATVWAWMMLYRRGSASIRHWICTIALVGTLAIPALAVVIPAWSLPILPARTVAEKSLAALPFSVPGIIKPINGSISPENSTLAELGESSKAKSVKIVHEKTSKVVAPVSDATNQPATFYLSLSWPVVILVLWMAGTLLTFARWLNQAIKVRRITRLGTPLSDRTWQLQCADLAKTLRIRRRIALVVSDQVSVPLTWGTWQPVVVFPASALDWQPDRCRMVLLHELVHIARWDYLTQWLALLSCAVNWFNPLSWKVAQHLAVEREQACDDQVLRMGTRGSDYAHNLLEIAQAARYRRAMPPGVLAITQGSNIAKRIRRILDSHQNRRPLTRIRCLSLLLILSIAVTPLSTVQLSRASAQNSGTVISLGVPGWAKNIIEDTNTLKDFESAHPGVTVAVVESPGVPDPVDGLDAYFTAMQKYATSADVLYTETFGNNLAVTPHGTRAGYFLDLAPLVEDDTSLNVGDFYPQMWRSFHWDKGIWALPLSGDVVVLGYERAAFDQAGLAYPDGKWTLSDFANAVTKLTLKDAEGRVVRPGFNNTGRIYRVLFWQSLLDVKLYDENVVPNMPQFDKPGAIAIVDTYRQLEQQGMIGNTAPGSLFVYEVSRAHYPPERGVSLLPGNRAGLLSSAVAVSAGTQHPDLAYDLAKYLTSRAEIGYGTIPARKSVLARRSFKSYVAPEIQSLVDEGIANGLTFADIRFTSYLNAANNALSGTNTKTRDALLAVEARAINDLKTATNKKGTLTLAIKEPEIPSVPPGKIALKFSLSTIENPMPTREQWDKVISDFIAADPQVGLINLRVTYESASVASAKSDCFYLPNNAVPSMNGNTLLPLDPFLNADASFDKADIPVSVMASVQRDNKTYALPINISPLILRYAPERFSAANVPEPTNGWTMEAFADTLRALKAKPATTDPADSAPFVDNDSNGTFLLVLIAAYGGLPLDYRMVPTTVNYTDAATVSAIRQVLDLAKNAYIRYGTLGSFSHNTPVGPNNTTALYPSRLDAFSVTKKVAGIDPNKPVLFPSGREFNGVAYSLGAAYISPQAQSPEACYRFISTIAKHPELFQTMPVRRSLLNSPALKSATNPDVLALYNQMNELLRDSRTVPIPVFSKGTDDFSTMLLQHWLYEAFDAYVLNSGDLDAALKTAEAYAKGYQGCTSTLPVLNLFDLTREGEGTLKAYVECATKIDTRLKPFLDQFLPS
jgi:ABC-type glycerol-3-phosphate transport system substrate-binding protein